jgi:hypothetical protein
MDCIQPRDRARISPEAEDILGQFFFAFGQGAGTMRVQRSAIAALRRRYAGAIEEASAEWNTAGPHVLGLVGQVGRLAAMLATQAGRAAITEADFTAARRAVETNVHHRAERNGQLHAGPYCPPVLGESDADLPVPKEVPVHAAEFWEHERSGSDHAH